MEAETMCYISYFINEKKLHRLIKIWSISKESDSSSVSKASKYDLTTSSEDSEGMNNITIFFDELQTYYMVLGGSPKYQTDIKIYYQSKMND